jgi:5-(carboxyamino)imidazole ribonucleotide mutase
VKVFICGAGGAAHLAGAVAALTTSPVIGVPLVAPNAVAGGLDALLSTVQMPRGVPVATVAVGEAGAANAGILAAEILATSDDELAGRLRMLREGMAAKVLAG